MGYKNWCQFCLGGRYFARPESVDKAERVTMTGDPVDVVRQQDQHHPPGRLRRADQVSGPGTRHLKAFLPSIHNISRRILQQIQ